MHAALFFENIDILAEIPYLPKAEVHGRGCSFE
jgi:hypothetical protein